MLLSVWTAPGGACSPSLLHALCVHQVSFSLPQTINHIKLLFGFSRRGSPSPLHSYSSPFIFLTCRTFSSKPALHNPKSLYNYQHITNIKTFPSTQNICYFDNQYEQMATILVLKCSLADKSWPLVIFRNQRSFVVVDLEIFIGSVYWLGSTQGSARLKKNSDSFSVQPNTKSILFCRGHTD